MGFYEVGWDIYLETAVTFLIKDHFHDPLSLRTIRSKVGSLQRLDGLTGVIVANELLFVFCLGSALAKNPSVIPRLVYGY